MSTRLAAAGLALAMAGGLRAQAESPQPMLGEPAPAFRLPDVRSGESLSLEDLGGRFVVLHFGASW
jgi:hypothetical protein